MRRIDFFREAVKAGCYRSKAWLISAFAIASESPEKYKQDSFPFRIVRTQTGVFFINPHTHELERIEDADPSEPLFTFKDEITVDSDVCANIPGSITTKLGQLLVNLICIVNAFGKKIPYLEGKVSVGSIEDMVAPRLRDTPGQGEERKDSEIYVDEYIKFVDSLSFLQGLAQLCVWTFTEKNIQKPKGIDEFKAKLVAKYGSKLHDPVELAKFEGELKAYDREYLSDDPSFGKFMSGKGLDVARKKMFLTIGAGETFDHKQSVDPIVNSLSDGWPTTPTDLTNMFNTVRVASYARGTETVNGGVASKVLLRAANNFKIQDTDCGTKLGIRRNLNRSNIKKLVGREILMHNEWLPIKDEEAAKRFQDQDIIVRSPMFCQLDGDNLCSHCTGERLASNPLGISMTLTEISAIIILTSLKKMHGTVLSTVKMDVDSTFS